MKRRRNVLRQTKGYKFKRATKERRAIEAIYHAGVHAFHDRRKKKRNMRKFWQIKIGSASKSLGISYSKLIDKLKKADIGLDRKILAQLSEHHPEVFEKIIKTV